MAEPHPEQGELIGTFLDRVADDAEALASKLRGVWAPVGEVLDRLDADGRYAPQRQRAEDGFRVLAAELFEIVGVPAGTAPDEPESSEPVNEIADPKATGVLELPFGTIIGPDPEAGQTISGRETADDQPTEDLGSGGDALEPNATDSSERASTAIPTTDNGEADNVTEPVAIMTRPAEDTPPPAPTASGENRDNGDEESHEDEYFNLTDPSRPVRPKDSSPSREELRLGIIDPQSDTTGQAGGLLSGVA